jgi:hypothetical protein
VRFGFVLGAGRRLSARFDTSRSLVLEVDGVLKSFCRVCEAGGGDRGDSRHIFW